MMNIMKIIKHNIRLIYKIIKKKYSRYLFNKSIRKKESEAILKTLKNKHEGQRAFIICNGPSLKPEDLTKIFENGDISIASNKIHNIFSKTNWRPTYYCVADEKYQFTLLDIMNQVPAEVKFFRTDSFVVTRKVESPTVWLNTDGNKTLVNFPKFSENIDEVIFAIATVTYMLVEIMVYMGVKELYIIGCDNSYSLEQKMDGTIVNHGGVSYFTGSENRDNNIIASTWEMNIAYEYLEKYGKKHGVKIFNATRGGHLEAFTRVDFDSLF